MSGRRIDRRSALGLLGAGAAAAGMGPSLPAGAGNSRPNIVFILTDDHRHDAFGFLNRPWLHTPHMDRIAQEGVHFQNAFVTTSLCSPSRASFLTGQYAHCHGVMNNLTPWSEDNLTFLELLHARGYRTGFVGKWHMPGGLPKLTERNKVDRFVSFTYGTGQGRYFDCPMIVDGRKVRTDGYITDVLTDYAMEFLDEGDTDQPFCLYLSHKAVHAMFKPPERYKGALDEAPLPAVREKDTDLPLGIVNGYQKMLFDKLVQGYYEALMGVDDSVGRVLGWLDDRGVAENTLVVYAGDNGYFWGEHGLVDKRYAYEESMRIPMLMRWPEVMPDGGATVEDMVLNIDVAPTILEAAAVETPAAVQGESITGLARGKSVEWRDSFLYEYFEDPGFPYPPIRAVRARDWKLVTYPGHDNKFPAEMYNLKDDPGEHENLADDPAHADKRRELEAELRRLMKEAEC